MSDELRCDGPIPGEPYLRPLGTTRNIASHYEEHEWFISGGATAYRARGALGPDGRWDVEPARTSAFRTRIVVRRPSDRSFHNGTTIVEWLNVTTGSDSDPDWAMTHRLLTSAGYAWIGVSAQAAGIDGGGIYPGRHLKLARPERYGDLLHPGDDFSYDIFTQVGALARDHGAGRPMAGLDVRRVLAVGTSQSAARLTSYVNAVAPVAGTFDGYLIHERPGGASGIDGPSLPTARPGHPSSTYLDLRVRIRDDLLAPVLVLQTETDVYAQGFAGARQPDSEWRRTWEVAGTAHMDTYLAAASRHTGHTTAAELAAMLAPTMTPFGPKSPYPDLVNAGPQHHYVSQAAIAALDRWVAVGAVPPAGEPLELDDDGAARVDEWGNAQGGIRTGWVDAPTAVLSGLPPLFGQTRPFDHEVLSRRYPGGSDQQLDEFAISTDRAIDAGFLLAADRREILQLAAAPQPPFTDEGTTP